MNLPYTYALLSATNEQRHGFIKLRGEDADLQVRWMVSVGLVHASFHHGEPDSFTSINRVRNAGNAFLRDFRGHTFGLPRATKPTEGGEGAAFQLSQHRAVELPTPPVPSPLPPTYIEGRRTVPA